MVGVAITRASAVSLEEAFRLHQPRLVRRLALGRRRALPASLRRAHPAADNGPVRSRRYGRFMEQMAALGVLLFDL